MLCRARGIIFLQQLVRTYIVLFWSSSSPETLLTNTVNFSFLLTQSFNQRVIILTDLSFTKENNKNITYYGY